MSKKIAHCRICKNANLEKVLDLGSQALSGTFPMPDSDVPLAPLALVRCAPINGEDVCGLLQMQHSFDLDALYGMNYGYRSSLNPSMVRHLESRLQRLLTFASPKSGDMVVDIGSNDATLLKLYNRDDIVRVGVDPTIQKFAHYYPETIVKIPTFFSLKAVQGKVGLKTAKAITSIAMLYDLEEPQSFVKEIASLLNESGYWLFEQSYMPTMIENTSYDTICHEHLEYYGMRQIKWLTEKAGLKIVDVEKTDANGGSLCVIATHASNNAFPESTKVAELIQHEERHGYNTRKPYDNFRSQVEMHKHLLREQVAKLNKLGRRVIGYGASTKGNVILQHCDFTSKDIQFIVDVNEEKVGKVTPGSQIPIVGEKDYLASAQTGDVLLPLPWHFRPFFEKKLEGFLKSGGSILYPLPKVELVTT